MRDGAEDLTLPQFSSFYKRGYFSNEQPNEDVTPPFYNGVLPLYIRAGKIQFVLRVDKPSFWRTFNQSEMNGESFYYQQVVLKKAVFGITFEELRSGFISWKGQ